MKRFLHGLDNNATGARMASRIHSQLLTRKLRMIDCCSVKSQQPTTSRSKRIFAFSNRALPVPFLSGRLVESGCDEQWRASARRIRNLIALG